MKRLIMFLLCLFFTFSILSAEWVPITSDKPEKPKIEVISDNGSEIVLKVSIPGYFTDEVEIDGEYYTFCKLDEGANLMEKGCPSLPFLVASLMINDQGEVTVATENEKPFTSKVERYMPSKGHFARNIDPATVQYTFSEVYNRNAFYPADTAQAFEPYILRNVRGVNVRMTPFQYNPEQGEMVVHSSMTIKVKTGRNGGANNLTEEMKVPESVDFESIYKNKFLNFGVNPSRYTAIGEVGNMLIITYNDFYDEMLPFYYWKQQKGIPVEMVTLTTAGSTAANVKTYIANYYNNNGLTFVLLVGDSGQFPVLMGSAENSASDPSYVLITGSDSYPEAFVSRFPASTSTEVQTMVNRVINYEKTPSSSASWYHEATGIAGDDYGGDPAMYDYERLILLQNKLESPAYNYTPFDELYPEPVTADTTNAVNGGTGLVLYINHGDVTYWPVSSFYVSNVHALTNTNMVPLVHSVACVNGDFDNATECFGESWQKTGTPAAPTGAIACYASSTDQSWVPPCDGQTGAVDIIVAESYHSIGGILVNGCMYGMDLWPGTEGNKLYQQWHIFGDASTMMFTDTPTAMTVTHSGGFPVGQTTYGVTVPGVEGALCALYDATNHATYGHAYTNSSGAATITLDPVPAAPVSLTLTVTAFNRMPYFDAVDVIPPSGPYLVYLSHTGPTAVDEDGDSEMEAGEKWSLSVTMKNIGSAEALASSAELFGEGLIICNNPGSFGDIAVNGSKDYTFEFVIDPDYWYGTYPCGSSVGLDLVDKSCNSGAYSFTDDNDFSTQQVGTVSQASVELFGPDDDPYSSGDWAFTNGSNITSEAHCSHTNNYARLRQQSYMTLDSGLVSTVGYTNIEVIFDWRTTNMDAGGADFLRLDYWDGSAWQAAGFQTYNNAWTCEQKVTLPLGAEGVSNFQIRFYAMGNGTGGAGTEYAGVDHVIIKGDEPSIHNCDTWTATCSPCILPSTPVIDSITDVNACAQSGVQVNYTTGTPATRHDLYVDGVLEVSDYTSGATYSPGDTTTHAYVVRAINGADSCYTNSNSMNGTDQNGTPSAPSISSVTDVSACAQSGVQVVYTAGSGAASHNLYDNGSLAVTGYVSGATYDPGDTASHTYTVYAINGTCTSAVSNSIAGTDANSTPATPTATNNGPVCAGGTLNLYTATVSGATYSWTGPNGFTSSLEDPTIAGATTAANGTYSVTVTVGGCTSAAGTTNAVVNALPTPSISGATANTCPAEYVDLAATGGMATYQWYLDGSPVGTGASTYQATASGSYTVFVTDANGCGGTSAPHVVTITTCAVIPGEVAVGTNYTWTGQTMNWTAHADATGYRVYRGLLSNLSALCDGTNDFCMRNDAAATNFDVTADDSSGQAGRCFYYLITGYSGAGEGPSGTATCGPRQVNQTGGCS